ncbi:MAG: hypothetical protein HY543_02915 [Deltaproteobacteria bacterium]|nr:hypothetical protein [Deltaproteobacteria bacterium]
MCGCVLSLLCAGCGTPWLIDKLLQATDDDDPIANPAPIIEPAAHYAIALGGVAPGRDELVLVDAAGAVRDLSGQALTFRAEPDIVGLLPRPSHASFAAGSGAQLVPQRAGTARIHYQLDGAEQTETFAVTVPPQELIQILLGEARALLAAEATRQEDDHVTLTSTSPTGDAVAAVIRNRIALIDADKDPSLFAADPVAYSLSPPASAYTAVIEAVQADVFQFAPLAPTDESHTVYANAEARSFLDAGDRIAYDQAVLTAAAMFDGRTPDPTGGAFAFRSPSVTEVACLTTALQNKPAQIPSECGPGDENFPALAPIQVLIHPDVGKQADGRPAFVFYRRRPDGGTVATDIP